MVLPKRFVIVLVAERIVVEIEKNRDERFVLPAVPNGDGLKVDVPPKSDEVFVPNFLFD